MSQPIDNITWVDPKTLTANDYNPNRVFDTELKLLEHSIISNGWIQPILVTKQNVIIDGFHRWRLALDSKKLQDLTDGKVPVATLDITEPERMLLTIRINRAKGTHVAIKMSEIIQSLIEDYGYDIQSICKGIGAGKKEVELLMMRDVFEAKDIKNYKYSKAWVPKKL